MAIVEVRLRGTAANVARLMAVLREVGLELVDESPEYRVRQGVGVARYVGVVLDGVSEAEREVEEDQE
jgi:hypothetical protein